MTLFGHFISAPMLYAQLMVGLINGSFYALLSLGLAVIFGMLNIVNFAHGAFYMVGAFVAYFLLAGLDVNYWGALILAPIIVGLLGAVVERTLLKRIAGLDHLYGLLLTFGLALVIEGMFQNEFGSSGKPYPTPPELNGAINIGFMYLPMYRGWVLILQQPPYRASYSPDGISGSHIGWNCLLSCATSDASVTNVNRAS